MQQNETIKNLFPGYYRKHDQDMETLADLTKRAKGDERSINEFARVCGVSPSTISRLINKKIQHQIRIHLLRQLQIMQYLKAA